MKVSTLGQVTFSKVIPGCDSSACAEMAELTTGPLKGHVALRFTERNPDDAVIATRQEVADIIKAAKAGDLDHLIA